MNTKYIKIGGIALLIFLAFRFFLPLIFPFVLAYCFGKILSPVIAFLEEKWHWKHKVSVTVVVFSVFAGLTVFVSYMISLVFQQSLLLLQKLPVYQQIIQSSIKGMCVQCDRMMNLAGGSSFHYVENQIQNLYHTIGGEVLPRISTYVTGILHWGVTIASTVFIFVISTLLILFDDTFPKIRGKIRPFMVRLRKAGLAYIKSQAIILFIIATIISLGLFLMGNEYAVIFGIGIAVFDAFPVMGSGVILVPWAIVKIVSGDYYGAAILFTVFAVATFFREILEPRLFGKELGLKPLYVLMSVYIGVQLLGLPGVLLGPVGLTILKVAREEIA